MVAETQPRSLTVTIAGTAWSEYLVDLTVSFDSYSQGSGLILKRGTLRLCNIQGGRTLDPRIQSSFNVGNTLTIVWNGSAHPLAGSMRILAPPSVDLIDDSLPAIEGNFLVSIPIGCNLAYWKTNEADDDKTGVTLGDPLGLEIAVANLISASSPSESKTISISAADYNLEFPYSKNGGSFIDLAGEFWYASDSQYPSVLYCNQSGTIVSKNIRVSGLSYSTFILLGTNDREYLPQIDSSFAPGIIRISGVKRNVIDTTADYPFTDTVTVYSQPPDPIVILSGITNSYYKEDNGSLAYQFNPLYRSYFYSTGTTSGSSFSLFSPPITKTIGLENKYTYNSTFTNEYIGRDLSSVNIIGEFYKDEKLAYTVDAKFVISQTMFPEGWEDAGDDDFQKIVLNNSATLHPSEVTIVSYKFNGSEISERTTLICSNLFLIDRNADFETEFDFAFTESRNGKMLLKQKTIEKWTRLKDKYLLSVTSSAPRIVNDPAYVSELTNAAEARNDRYLLQSKLTKAKKRELEPPAITYWSGRYTIEEENLSSSVTFGSGTNSKELSIQMPFVFNESQLDSYAKVEGEIINGRQYQHLIECDPSLFSTVTEPMTGVRVVEPTGNKFFLCDALTWYHSQYEDYVGFAGIYVGSGVTGSTSPGQKPQAIVGNEDIEATIGLTGTITQDVVTGAIYD